MHRSFLAIDATILRTLDIDQRLTIDRIGRELGCGASTVSRRLRRFGTSVRRRGPDPGRNRQVATRVPIPWRSDLAWIVGLIATDGNLSRKPSQIRVVSNDVELLDAVRRRLALRTSIRRHVGGWGQRGYHITWNDRTLYEWLIDIGLTPAKSLTLGPIAVPDQYFRDFFRGCIDGDGSVLTYIDRYHTVKNAEYVYGRLYVSLVSASHGFVEWMLATLRRLLSVRGWIDVDSRAGRRPIYRLRFAKRDSTRIVRWMYYAPDVACLGRKRIKAERFLSGEHPRILGAGGVSEQVDDTDSKSVARKGVGVRVPSPLPTPILDTG